MELVLIVLKGDLHLKDRVDIVEVLQEEVNRLIESLQALFIQLKVGKL